MKKLSSALLISLLLLTACSASLQTRRMDTAEDHIVQAEQAAKNNNSSAVTENVGSAKAYFATINDNRSQLTINEQKRLSKLKQRAANVSRRH